MSNVENLELDILNELYENIDSHKWVEINELLIKSDIGLPLIRRLLKKLLDTDVIELSDKFAISQLGAKIEGVEKTLFNHTISARLTISKGVEYYNQYKLNKGNNLNAVQGVFNNSQIIVGNNNSQSVEDSTLQIKTITEQTNQPIQKLSQSIKLILKSIKKHPFESIIIVVALCFVAIILFLK